MARRLTPDERLLRDKSAPKVGAVVAYGTAEDGYRIGRVEAVDVDREGGDEADPQVILKLSNRLRIAGSLALNPGSASLGTTWYVAWEPFVTTIVPSLSLP